MPFSATPKSLIVYSSPAELDRLRLDKEHKAIEQVLAKHKLPDKIIKRIHAATIMDVGLALREQDYEVIQFSCHGDENGLYLEEASKNKSISWLQVSQTLKNAAPSLSVIILNACYSSNAEKSLHVSAPFLLLMDGAANDEAAITFSQHFFDEFYRTTTIDQAFRHAVWILQTKDLSDSIRPLLTRRQPLGESVVQACFYGRHDSIFIDLAEAEASIALLPISRHEFLAKLTTKMRVHNWIFRIERDHAVIPIGQFFGVFSWRNANDVVVCHTVLQLKSDIVVEDCMGWTWLMISYNDLRSERYRALSEPAAPENKGLLAEALRRLNSFYEHTLIKGAAARKLAPSQYVVTLSTVRVQCDLAERDLQSGDLSRVVFALETAISSIHDLLDELTARVTLSHPRLETARIKG